MLNTQTELSFEAHDHDEPLPRHEIARPVDILTYATAGDAVFTLQGKTTRFTYRVTKSEDGKIFFVKLMTGSDNETSYRYVGLIRNTEAAEYEHGRKAKISEAAPGVKAFKWFWHALVTKDEAKLAQLTFWHEGRCGRCHRRLTVPESIERGLGPDCAAIMGI